jgi:hypothetical protein
MMVLNPDRSAARARNAFRELILDFERAAAAYPALKAYRQGQDRLDKLSRCIEELKHFYDAQPLVERQMPIDRVRPKKQSVMTSSSSDLNGPLS